MLSDHPPVLSNESLQSMERKESYSRVVVQFLMQQVCLSVSKLNNEETNEAGFIRKIHITKLLIVLNPMLAEFAFDC